MYYTRPMSIATTETAARERGKRRGHSFRCWDATWDDVEARASAERSDATTVINDAVEAALGYVRCYQCFTPVPARIGDLEGRPLADWLPAAAKAVRAQKCAAHQPVTIGTVESAAERKAPRSRKAPAPVAADGGKAAVVEHLRSQIDEVTERMKPAKRPAAPAPVRFADGTGQQAAW